MNGREKATLLLSILGPQLSATVLRRLSEPHAKKLSSAINNLPPPNPKTLPDFFYQIDSFVRQVESKNKTEEELTMQVPSVSEAADPVLSLKPGDIKSIQDLTPAMLWEALATEKPQTLAFFIKNLSDDIREALAVLLPSERVKDLAQRSVFDHELSQAIFSDLSQHVLQFWREKLDPEHRSTQALLAS